MSNFNKKGYTQIPKVRADGQVVYSAVKIGSATHRKYMRNYKKWVAKRKAENKLFKAELAKAKKIYAARVKDRELAAQQEIDF